MENNTTKMNNIEIHTNEEFAKALKEKPDRITVTGDLAKKVVVIEATGKASWVIALGCVAFAVGCILATPAATVTTGGTGGAITFTGSAVGAGAAFSVLGTAAYTAIAIGVAAGGVGVLKTLKSSYKIESKEKDKVVLKRKR